MSQELFDGTHGSLDEHASGMSTAVSPVRSTSRPLSQEAGLTYTDLSGPSYSSTPADRQRGRGTRPFTYPSPVPSTSTSSKRARIDDDSADLRLFLNSSVNTSFPSPYDEIPDDDAVESAALGPRAIYLDPSSGVGTSRATCNLHSRPGWTGTSRNAWRMLWSVR